MDCKQGCRKGVRCLPKDDNKRMALGMSVANTEKYGIRD
jgi:hypothetical protein